MEAMSRGVEDRGMDISGALIERVGRAGTDPSFRIGADAALKVEGLAKAFGKHQVLRQISLAVRAGEIVGLLGRDGADKTLCFDLIMGFARPDAGCISLRGTDVTELPVEQRTLLNLKARTVGLLVSDQNLPEMFAIMDRVCVLHEGRILFEGSPEEMLADARVRRFYLGEISAGNLIDRVAAQSGDGAGAAIRPQGPESAGPPPRDGRINDLGAGADARPGPERVPCPPEMRVRGFANHPASVAVRAVPLEKECSDEPVRSA